MGTLISLPPAFNISDFTLSGHVGYQSIDDGAAFGIGDDTYTDWSVGLGYTLEGFDDDYDIKYAYLIQKL